MKPGMMALRTHLTGLFLLLLAFSCLATMQWLPQNSNHTYTLPFLPDDGVSVHLVYAGFPGCGTACPTAMMTLSTVVGELRQQHASVIPDVTFVNIERDTPHQITERYTHSWDPEFNAYSITSAEAGSLYRALTIRSFQNSDAASAHLSPIYLFHRDRLNWKLAHIYPDIPTARRIIRDIKTLQQTALRESQHAKQS